MLKKVIWEYLNSLYPNVYSVMTRRNGYLFYTMDGKLIRTVEILSELRKMFGNDESFIKDVFSTWLFTRPCYGMISNATNPDVLVHVN
jgi:hypothetical protein